MPRFAQSVADFENQYPAQVRRVAIREAASRRKLVGLAKRAKQAIPPSDVAMAEIMQVKLVVDRVML